MKRWILRGVLAALLVVAAVFGALNGQSAEVDFLAFTLHMPIGLALMLTLLIGALIGGLALYLGTVLPLQRRLKQARSDKPAA